MDYVSPALSSRVSVSGTIRDYWFVVKPGILVGNLASVTAGFLLASRGSVDIAMLLATVLGVGLIVASACVLNNCIDRDIDCLMVRTRGRALAKGRMSPRTAVTYALVLGLGGGLLLATADNRLSLAIVVCGFAVYTGLYSLYLKRNSASAPLVGSLAGAAPPLAGYCAVSNHFDAGALILLSIFGLWQMPHFYAIAIYRLEDYAAAAIPVLPVKKGVLAAKRHIIGYILAFTAAALMLTFGGYTGYCYLAVALVLGLIWLSVAWAAYKTPDDRLWVRELFVCSLVIIFILNIMMSVDSVPRPAVGGRSGAPFASPSAAVHCISHHPPPMATKSCALS